MYKLIKTPEQYVIVSNNDVIVKGNLYYNTRLQNVYEAIANSGYNTVDKEFKVIAQQNEIDFNGFEDIIGYVDVEKLAEINSEKHHYAFGQQSEFYQLGYIEGFQKSQELSSNKQFTLEDMKRCYMQGWNMGREGNATSMGNYFKSLQLKEWLIEIQHVDNKIKITKIL